MFDSIVQSMRSALDLVKGKKSIQAHDVAAVIARVQEALIAADVPYALATRFGKSVREELVGGKVATGVKAEEQVFVALFRQLTELLGGKDVAISLPRGTRCMLVGLQGAGKTTTAGKLAAWCRDEARQRGTVPKILMVSLDFQRPAAREQLEILAQRVGCDFYRTTALNARAAAREVEEYLKRLPTHDLVLIDTAGRMHTESDLMAEVSDVKAILKPQQVYLVVDGMLGQASLQVARDFNNAVGITGAIITKFDSGARAGVALAFRSEVSQPVVFVGTGESLSEFERFIPERIAQRILGEGDIATLVERVEAQIGRAERERLEQEARTGDLTLEMYAQQMKLVGKMGSLQGIMKYLPGMGNFKVTPEQIKQGERDLKKAQAIIDSMTPRERKEDKILNGSRKTRIARGAGVTVKDVDNLLFVYQQTKQYAKMLKNMKMPW